MSRDRVLLALAIIGSVVILVTGLDGRSSLMSAPVTSHSIVGSWVFIPVGIPGRAPGTPTLITSTSDGTVLVSDPTAALSGGHGVWARTGDRTVTDTLMLSRRNGAGDFIGISKVRRNMTLNATFDEVTGSGKIDSFDAGGMLIRPFGFTVRGTRIRLEEP